MADPIILDTFEDGTIGQPYLGTAVSAGGAVYSADAAIGSRGLYLEAGISAVIGLEPDSSRAALGVGGYFKVIDEGLGGDTSAVVSWESRASGSSAGGFVQAAVSRDVEVIELDAAGDEVRHEVVGEWPPNVWIHLWAHGSAWFVGVHGGGTIASGSFATAPETGAAWGWQAGSITLGDSFIDHPYYWPARIAVVRQYPRDDEYGYSGGRRLYPPPRLARIIGRQS